MRISQTAASNLIKIAEVLDQEGDFNQSDIISNILVKASNEDENAIRVANIFSDWWNNFKGNVGEVGKGLKQVGQGIWNTDNAAAKTLGFQNPLDMAAKTSPIPGLGAAYTVGQTTFNTAVNAINMAIENEIGRQLAPMQKQQLLTRIKSNLQGALAAHKQHQNGWQILMPSIKDLPANVQNTIKQQFMLMTGKYTS